MRSFKRKLVFRTSASLVFAVTLAVLSSSFVHYNRTKEAIKGKLISLASACATQIDVEGHELLKSSDDMSSDFYKKSISTLNKILKNDPIIRYIYTLRPIEGINGADGYEFVLDGASAKRPPGPENKEYSKLGDRYDNLSLAALVALRTGKAVAEDKEKLDAWGWTISGYAPIKNKKGKTVAILGVDITAKDLRETLNTVFLIAGIAIIIATFFGILLAQQLVGFLIHPLDQLRGAAERIGTDDLSTPIRSRRQDEFGLVFSVFNRMMVSIEKSRQTLVEKAKLDSELEIAASLQKQLFNWQVLDQKNIMLGNYIQMANSTGGDWAHYHLANQRYLYMVCADVVGHGIPSAIVASSVAGCFESLKFELDSAAGIFDLEKILMRIQRVVLMAGRGTFPMTMFLLVVDLMDGAVKYASSAHPAARILSELGAKRQIRRLISRSDFIGNDLFTMPKIYEEQLKPNDYIIMFTDGLFERQDNNGRHVGLGRLDKILVKTKTDSAQELCSEILAGVEEYTPNHKVDDDTSILILKFLGPMNTLQVEDIDKVA
jgi:serine phosphatase RsbU (regulator of sigma subunit)